MCASCHATSVFDQNAVMCAGSASSSLTVASVPYFQRTPVLSARPITRSRYSWSGNSTFLYSPYIAPFTASVALFAHGAGTPRSRRYAYAKRSRKKVGSYQAASSFSLRRP